MSGDNHNKKSITHLVFIWLPAFVFAFTVVGYFHHSITEGVENIFSGVVDDPHSNRIIIFIGWASAGFVHLASEYSAHYILSTPIFILAILCLVRFSITLIGILSAGILLIVVFGWVSERAYTICQDDNGCRIRDKVYQKGEKISLIRARGF